MVVNLGGGDKFFHEKGRDAEKKNLLLESGQDTYGDGPLGGGVPGVESHIAPRKGT